MIVVGLLVVLCGVCGWVLVGLLVVILLLFVVVLGVLVCNGWL